MSKGTGTAPVPGGRETGDEQQQLRQNYTAGAGHTIRKYDTDVINGRELDLAATWASATNTATFTAGENFDALYITIFADPAALEVAGGAAGDYGAPQAEQKCIMVADAPDDATATSWLTQLASKTAASQKHAIPYGVRTKFVGASYFSRIDINTDVAATAIIEAA